MWNTRNKELVDKYGSSAAIPSNAEYGEYIIRELLSFGYPVKKLYMSGNQVYAFSIQLFTGVSAVLFCHTAKNAIDQQTTQSIMAFRSMYKASRYGIVTNTAFVPAARKLAETNGVVLIEDFRIGHEIVDLMAEMEFIPRPFANKFVAFAAESDERRYQEALEEEIRRKEEEKRRREAEEAAREERPLTALEKYDAGMYGDDVTQAIIAVGNMDVVSAGGLARKMHTNPEHAKQLLIVLEQLGVVSRPERSKPREVLMTAGMLEKRFRVSIPAYFGR